MVARERADRGACGWRPSWDYTARQGAIQSVALRRLALLPSSRPIRPTSTAGRGPATIPGYASPAGRVG